MLSGPKFPCTTTKRPASGNGFYSAQPNVDDSAWELVGIPTGAISGFDVVDVDVEGMDWLSANAHKLPLTRVQVTRSGGRHLFFRHVEGMRCSAGRIAAGVDVRADGGYVIDWSREGYATEIREIAEWPEWLSELAMPATIEGPHQTVRAMGALRGPSIVPSSNSKSNPFGIQRTGSLRARCTVLVRQVEYARPGRRNELLNWSSYRFGQMIAEGVIRQEIAELLLEGAAKTCGLVQDDGINRCRATIKSGIGAGIRDFNDLMKDKQ